MLGVSNMPRMTQFIISSAISFTAVFALAMPARAASDLETVQEAYVAYYGRPADPAGLSYWAGQLAGSDLTAIIDEFASSTESNQLYAGMSDQGKITFIYRVLFNRDPDSAGMQFWANELASGNKTLQEIALSILQGAISSDRALIANKLAAGTHFSDQLSARDLSGAYTVQADIFLARNWLGAVDADLQSVDAAKAAFDDLANKMQKAGTTDALTGFLIKPETTVASAVAALRTLGKAVTMTDVTTSRYCSGVPDGYVPLSGALMKQIDAFGQFVGTPATTDDCGFFVADMEALTTHIQAEASGYRPVVTSVTAFQDPDQDQLPDPVSLIPDTSSYEISGLRRSGTRGLFFNVLDSATKKAVLGLTPTQISVTNNSAPLGVDSLGYSSSITQSAASVSMVLDASGSMGKNDYEAAAAAANLFITRKSSADEISVTVFDDEVVFFDQAGLNDVVARRNLTFTDGSGNPLLVTPPVDGFTTSALFPEQMVKLFDRYSDAWDEQDFFFNISGRFPWGGSTAMYDAVGVGIDHLSTRQNRRYVLAMTDGRENSSNQYNLSTVTTHALSNGVVVFTVGAGTSVDVQDLTDLATQTGGQFHQVGSASEVSGLASVFDAIRTSITYDYAATLAADPQPGPLALSVDFGGDVVSAEINIQ